MTPAIPVIDVAAAEAGDRAQLDAVRTATEEFGAVQVVNHGVPQDLVADLNARMARLLGLPRAEKAKLASPHPYRGWRQWPDDFGRLELERFNVAEFDDIEAARAAGVPEEYLGLFAHANLWPEDDPGLREVAAGYIAAAWRLARTDAQAVCRGAGAARGLVRHRYPAAPPADRERLPDLDVSGYRLGRGQAAAARASRRLGDDGAGPAGRLRGAAGPGSRRLDPVPVRPGALQVFSGHLLARWTGGRLRPGQHRVVAGGTVTRRSMAVFVYPALDAVVGPLPPFSDGPGAPPVLVWDHVKDRVADYLAEYGLPEQVAAWRDGLPYVAELAENSAGQ